MKFFKLNWKRLSFSVIFGIATGFFLVETELLRFNFLDPSFSGILDVGFSLLATVLMFFFMTPKISALDEIRKPPDQGSNFQQQPFKTKDDMILFTLEKIVARLDTHDKILAGNVAQNTVAETVVRSPSGLPIGRYTKSLEQKSTKALVDEVRKKRESMEAKLSDKDDPPLNPEKMDSSENRPYG